MRAVDIIWGTEDVTVPTEIEIPDGIVEDEVGEYLSDMTGCCHESYVLEH